MFSGPCAPRAQHQQRRPDILHSSEDFSSAAVPAADLSRGPLMPSPFAIFVLLILPRTPSDSEVASWCHCPLFVIYLSFNICPPPSLRCCRLPLTLAFNYPGQYLFIFNKLAIYSRKSYIRIEDHPFKRSALCACAQTLLK